MLKGYRQFLRKFVSVAMVVVFAIGSMKGAYAQQALVLPASGAVLSSSYNPILIKGLKIYPDNPLRFDFIVDKGQEHLSGDRFKAEAVRLIEYFVAALAIPEKDLWVNLSPYEKERVIPEAFGQTGMGQDLLLQDYILKQVTASLLDPRGNIGKEFWARVYAEAVRRYGSADVPIESFNKVWIVPEQALIYEGKNVAYVAGGRLKVLLEEDYLALEKRAADQSAGMMPEGVSQPGSEIVREVVIPVLENEVNTGKNFVLLRQIYQSLILAVWFKEKIRESLLDELYVGQNKIKGVDTREKAQKDRIWEQYVASFRQGMYSHVQEEVDPVTKETVPRKYLVGGMGFERIREAVLMLPASAEVLSQAEFDKTVIVRSDLELIDKAMSRQEKIDALQEIQRALSLARDPLDAHKAFQRLMGLSLDNTFIDQLIDLARVSGPYKDIVSIFTLALVKALGFPMVNIKPGARLGPNHGEALLSALSPGSYYSLMNLYVLFRLGGQPNDAVDRRIIGYARMLDDGGYLDSPDMKTWFASLRTGIHTAVDERYYYFVREVLRFWDRPDRTRIERVITDRKITAFSNRDIESICVKSVDAYQRIVGRLLAALEIRPELTSDERIEELTRFEEEHVIATLIAANQDEAGDLLDKVKALVRLYFALGEKYTRNLFGAQRAIRGVHSSEEDSFDVGRQELESLMAALDQADERNSLKAIAGLRLAIKEYLMTSMDGTLEETDKRRQIAELDQDLHVLGRHYVNRVLNQDLTDIKSVADVRGSLQMLISVASFVQAQGLGGNDFGQYLSVLRREGVSDSQLYDLIRALQSEVIKSMGRLNRSIHLVAPSVFREELLKTQNRWSGFAPAEVEGEIVDELVRDSGLDVLKQVLTIFERALEKVAVVKSGGEYQKELQEPAINHLLRFGRGIGPAESLSLWKWGSKGSRLRLMSERGIPVPQGVAFPSELGDATDFLDSPEFRARVDGELAALRKGPVAPVFVRSGSAFMLPGLLMTIANVGMNDVLVEQMARETGDTWFAYDTYASFLRSYGVHVLGIEDRQFAEVFGELAKDPFSVDQMQEVVRGYKKIIADRGLHVPEDIVDQVIMSVKAIYASWHSPDVVAYRQRHGLSDDWGTSAIIQGAVFGNRAESAEISGAGSASLMIDPDGKFVLRGEFRPRGQGDLIMSGADTHVVPVGRSGTLSDRNSLEIVYPEIYRNLLSEGLRLREMFGCEQLIEFVIDQGVVWITQSNDDFDRDDGLQFSDIKQQPLVRGKGLSGGAVRVEVASSIPEARKRFELFRQRLRAAPYIGQEIDGVVLLVDRVTREVMSQIPAGVHILARKLSVHAVSLAQQEGITVVAEIPDEEMFFSDVGQQWVIGGQPLKDGEVISMDGHRNPMVHESSGHLYRGRMAVRGEESAESAGSRDKAQLQDIFSKGGIDLTQSGQLQVSGNGNGGFHFNGLIALRLENAVGLAPNIIGIQQMTTSLADFMGLENAVERSVKGL